jgi:hypothetical protein
VGYKPSMRRKSDKQMFWAIVALAVVNAALLVWSFMVTRSVAKFISAAEAMDAMIKRDKSPW